MRVNENSFVQRGPKRPLAVVLGTNETASAVAVHLHRLGWGVVLSHDSYPPVIRRQMAFHDCLFGDRVVLDQVTAERAETALELFGILDYSPHVVVTPLQFHDLVAWRAPDALVDARLQGGRVTPDLRHLAGLTVGLGPDFSVGRNCDIAIEMRPAHLGRLATDPEAAQPGGGEDGFVHAPHHGLWHTAIDIGVRVFKGFVVGHLDGTPIEAPLDGVLRGVARDGLQIPAGVRLLDIDPRGRAARWTGIDEATELVASAVARAVRIELAKRAAAPAVGPVVTH